MVGIVQDSQGLFDDPNRDASSGLVPLQVSSSQPVPPTLERVTNPLVVDRSTSARLAHFEPTLYDLSPTSHLVRFMKSLLGDSGAGQLSKRYTVARLSTLLEGSHFYDLDGFYGALFSTPRKVDEVLPINPYVETTTQDSWDDIESQDASYRERIINLAKALPLAGTVPGLKQAAEAILSSPVDIIETWQLIDSGITASVGRDWDDIETAFPTWDAPEQTMQVWASMESGVQVGRSGVNNRNEVVIRTKKTYTPASSDPDDVREALRRQEEDAFMLMRVLDRLRPPGILLSLDTSGVEMNLDVPIGDIVSDSENWEIVTRTRPRADILNSVFNPYPQPGDDGYVVQTVPPMTVVEGFGWSHNASVVSVNAMALADDGSLSPTSTHVVSAQDWEVASPPPGSTTRALRIYSPPLAIADPRTLSGAQVSSDSILTAHPYAGTSQPALDLRSA